MSERWQETYDQWKLANPYEDEVDDDDGLCPDCDQVWEQCECSAGEECGRWVNGRLTQHCTKAGSEDCDFECPYRNSLKF